MRVLITIAIAVLFNLALTAQQTTFADWDTDGDGLIERHEFTTKFVTDYFTAWGGTEKEGILEEGFFKESYAGLDTDNDNYLSDEEWLLGYHYFYEDYVAYDDLDFLDADEDGKLTYKEYFDAIYDTDFYSKIVVDSDGYLTEYELAYYVFDNWDFNDSQTLSRSEFNRFDWYYLDI